MLGNILSSLGFSIEESKTYTTLLETGPTTAGKLAKAIGAPRPSTYGFLAKLVEKGVIEELDDGAVKTFVAKSPEVITGLFRTQAEDLVRKRIQFERMIPDLENMNTNHVLAPRYQAFEGREEMQAVLKDMMLFSDIETRAFWPAKAMAGMLPATFWASHDKLRIQNRVSIKAIWPADQVIRSTASMNDQKTQREIRISPPQVSSSMGYWIYKNKVAFFSSTRKCSGFVIESAEMAEMMNTQHAALWESCESIESSDHGPISANDLAKSA